MKRLFVVTGIKGNAWNPANSMSGQDRWDEHAVFMNELADNRFIILGGPVGEGDTVLLVVDSSDEEEIRSTFAGDPWSKSGLLEILSIQPWTVLLQAGPEKAPVVLRLLPPPAEIHPRQAKRSK